MKKLMESVRNDAIAAKKRRNRFNWGAGQLQEYTNAIQEDIDPGKGPFAYTAAEHGTYENPKPGTKPTESYLGKHAEEFDKHAQTLNYNHRAAIEEYKDDSEELNTHLRDHEGLTNDHPQYNDVRHLDHVTNHRLTKPLTVYRGFGEQYSFANHDPGKTFVDHGFASTSTDPNEAKTFGNFHPVPGTNATKFQRVYAKIHLPEGTKAFHVDDVANTKNEEKEVLLARGTKFRVLGHTRHTDLNDGINSNHHVVHLEAIPHEE